MDGKSYVMHFVEKNQNFLIKQNGFERKGPFIPNLILGNGKERERINN